MSSQTQLDINRLACDCLVKIRGALKFDLLRFYVSRLQKQSDDFKSVHHFEIHFGRFEFEYQVEKREENKDKIEVIMINKTKLA